MKKTEQMRTIRPIESPVLSTQRILSHAFRRFFLKQLSLLALFLVSILLLPLLAACDVAPQVCTVTYLVDGETYASVTAPFGSPMPVFPDPEKENRIFLGWFTDPSHTVSANHLTTVPGDVTLYAAFSADAAALTNTVTQDLIRSIVTIHHISINESEHSRVNAQGSGVIFDISGGYCYVLTNCHVAQTGEGYSHRSYEIVDATGHTYQAWLYRNPAKEASAISEKHDLAVLYFALPEDAERVTWVPFGEDPEVGETVLTLGTPGGQRNAIAYGRVQRYKRISVAGQDDTNCITFEAIEHSAFIAGGSSGGALLDAELHLVGINYAGHSESDSGREHYYSYSVPISRVREFLSVFVYGG